MPKNTISPPSTDRTTPDPHATQSPWKDLLAGLAKSYWRDAEYVYRLAKTRKASFKNLPEDKAIHCVRGCLTEISLILEQQYPRGKAESVRVERAGNEVRVASSNENTGSLDLSRVVGSVTAASGELKGKDSEILAEIIINELFKDEIDLPGFAREVVSGDTIILTLLPDDAKKQLRYRKRNGS